MGILFVLLNTIGIVLGKHLSEVSNDTFIWPIPSEFTKGAKSIYVFPSCDIFYPESPVPSIIGEAIERYCHLTFPHITHEEMGKDTMLHKLFINWLEKDDSFPQVGTDESYVLNITDGAIGTLQANTVYGVLRGLETFSQLVTFNFDSKLYEIHQAPWKIKDKPRFPHRGLMIDTARHFETLASLRHIIDSLSYAKMNVLHWHMSDAQSFPFESRTYPKLWNGAYSDFEKYTQEDIADVVEYARMRGVRVMVEFDMPGHADSWCKGYPEVCPSATCTQPLNVAKNATFELISSVLNECTGGKKSEPGAPSGLFPDDFIHLGGDEVNTACWMSTPEISSWLTAQNMTADDGYAYFLNKVATIASSQGRRPVQWSEAFDHFKKKLLKGTIVHIWKAVTNVTEVLADGYNVLLNVGNDIHSWYLDNVNVKWDSVYMKEPCGNVPDDLCPLILGGHGEMWGERVDASDVQQTVWPRLAAIAERLWSPREYNSTTKALPRIEYFRCLLNRRGIESSPVNNAIARSAPPGVGSCLVQRRRV